MRRADVIGTPLAATANRPILTDFIPQVVADMATSGSDATPLFTTVAPSATAHTKGSWVELYASTAADASLVVVSVTNTALSSGAGGALMDIGVGAIGAEVVVVPNWVVSNASTSLIANPGGMLPLSIPRGSRVAVRIQSARAAAGSPTVSMYLMDWPKKNLHTPRTLDNLTSNTATTAGLAVGTTSNVWTEVSSSLSQSYMGFVINMMSNDTTMAATGVTQVDLGLGSAGNERATAMPPLGYSTSSEGYAYFSPVFMPNFVPLRATKGQRLAVRYRDPSIAQNTPSIGILGVPYA